MTGKELRNKRTFMGFTAEDIAEMLGVCTATVTAIERENRSGPTTVMYELVLNHIEELERMMAELEED